ncbi:hypothetical protein ATW69_09595 [Oenococcus oeni]|uniref:hypothetical protein n=3 Tax=Oenococcus oeni TaxID=1247 RepID=UPI0008F91502|nr:hypothetical protein [Oenococcus oeni]OIL68704.1 hypothetical protein ATX30_07445 [Oenococcus oeni]OIM47687.1 hypothetical protein ATX76_07465 [Oenococcus oeni]OLQ32734.1 hypothetical protein ATW69_09595 [Oenococcus oeni]
MKDKIRPLLKEWWFWIISLAAIFLLVGNIIGVSEFISGSASNVKTSSEKSIRASNKRSLKRINAKLNKIKFSLRHSKKEKGYYVLSLTANTNRQATITGRISGDNKLYAMKRNGLMGNNKYSKVFIIKANKGGNFKKIVNLSKNEPKETFYIDSKRRIDTLKTEKSHNFIKVVIKSSNYKEEMAAISSSKAASSSSEESSIEASTSSSQAAASSESAASAVSSSQAAAVSEAKQKKESRANLKAALAMDGLPEQNYLNVEKQTMTIVGPKATTSWQATHQFNVLKNIKSLRKEAKSNFSEDESDAVNDYTPEDLAYLKNYARKLAAYLQAFHDWAAVYMEDDYIYNDPTTSASDKQELGDEMNQFQSDFNTKKQAWLSEYNSILSLPDN